MVLVVSIFLYQYIQNKIDSIVPISIDFFYKLRNIQILSVDLLSVTFQTKKLL